MIRSNNHALVITNNQASKLKRLGSREFSREIITPLKNSGIKRYDILDRPTDTELDSGIQQDSLIAICGGDGTVTRVVDYILQRSLPNAILPLPFGGANDISNGLYGSMGFENILELSSPEIAHSIEATIEDGDNKKIVRALGYIGIGVSGQAAKAINNYQDADSTERGAIMRAAYTALTRKPFIYLDSDKTYKNAFEILAINHRMGRYVESSSTTFNPEFTYIKLNTKLQMIGKFCMGLLSILDGPIIEKDNTENIEILSPTVLQSDGENFDVEPGTKITIKSGPAINVMRVNHSSIK